MGDEYITPDEIAAELKIHRNTVLNWIRSGRLKAERYGPRLFRILKTDYEQFKRDIREGKK